MSRGIGRKFEVRKSAILVENPAAAAGTGLAIARITGIHPALFIGVGLAYYTNDGHRPAGGFGANLFKLFQYDQDENGQKVQLSGTAINGSAGAGQSAPDKWEGTTTLAELEVDFTWVGFGATDLGRWEVILTIGPAIDMCESDFVELAGGMDILVPIKVVAT